MYLTNVQEKKKKKTFTQIEYTKFNNAVLLTW